MKKAKRRLTVDPIDFGLGLDYSVESRGRSNQVEARQRQPAFIRTRLICMHSHKGPSVYFFSVCFCFLSLPNIVCFGKTILHQCWELSLFILISGHALIVYIQMCMLVCTDANTSCQLMKQNTILNSNNRLKLHETKKMRPYDLAIVCFNV